MRGTPIIELSLAFALVAVPGLAAAAPGETCTKRSCDYATGDGCRDAVDETDTIFPMEVESLSAIEGRAKACALWHGPTGCYQKRIKADIADLPLVAAEVNAVQRRAGALPETARRACEGQRPTLSASAIDEVAAWCVTGQQECVGALQAARIMVGGMQGWHACVERMEARVAENARMANEPEVCVATPAPVAPKPEPVATKPEPVATKPAPIAPKPEVRVAPKPLKVVEAESSGVRFPGESNESEAERTALEEDERPRRYDDEPGGPMGGSAIVSVSKPKPMKDRRRGQVELSVAPFSGVLGIVDPATDADYQPLSASVQLGLGVVVDLSRGLGLELAITGRGAFASSALEQAATVSLADLDTSSGTAFTGGVEPTVTLLSEYVGIGVVTDFRWDSIGITSVTTGLVETNDSGAAGGMRLVAGYGLLKKQYRFIGWLDYLFAGKGDPVWRATLRAELGPFLLAGQYIQFFRLAGNGEAHLRDQMQLTLGVRMAF